MTEHEERFRKLAERWFRIEAVAGSLCVLTLVLAAYCAIHGFWSRVVMQSLLAAFQAFLAASASRQRAFCLDQAQRWNHTP